MLIRATILLGNENEAVRPLTADERLALYRQRVDTSTLDYALRHARGLCIKQGLIRHRGFYSTLRRIMGW